MTHLVGKESRLNFWQKLRWVSYDRFLHRFTVGDLINRISQDYNFTRFMHGFNIVETLDIIIFTTLGFRVDALH